ncbi:UNVERIFIED_ORG: hypothetical protein J2X79_004339 [Arthrobacter globiformis]|nr:hypothetical protein [Arthrobacter globiformis]
MTLERVDDDRPFSVWLSREEAAKLGELLIRQSGLVGEARSGLAQAKGRRQAT